MENNDKNYNPENFNHYFLFSSLPNVKAGLWVTILIFFFSALIHNLCFPGSAILQYIGHSVILLPFIALTLVIIYFKIFHKWLHTLLVILNLLTVVALFIFCATSDINNPGYMFFLPWSMLVLMGTFIFYRIRFRLLLTTICLLVAAITIAMVVNHTLRDKPEIFLVNVSYLFSMASLGYFIISYRSFITRKLFLNERKLIKTNKDLVHEILERKIADETVIQSEKKYRELLEAIPDLISVVDRDFNIVIVNSAIRQKNKEFGIYKDVIGRNLFEVYPFIDQRVRDEYNHVLKEEKELLTELPTTVNGITYFAETRKIPIFTNDVVSHVMTIVRDISKKMELEALKQKNAEQKEILLREIHHRVKNNLAIVISLLGMQVRENKNPEFKKLSDDIELRIRSMALIHEYLYKSEELDRIPFGDYIYSLASIISTTYVGHNIKLKTKFDPAMVKIETAMPLGLIANEILTNAFKYAFPGNRPGVIQIELKALYPEKGLYSLLIKDNGIGLPESFSIDTQNSLGIYIIRLLVQQIEAELTILNHNGTSFNIVFKAIATTNHN